MANTTEVSYRGNRLIPAPFCSISKNFIRSQNGEIIGSTFSISIDGKLCADNGSPMSSGTFWNQPGYPPSESVSANSRLTSLLRKEEAVRQLFNADGGAFIIQGADGGTPLSCFPRVIGPIQFNEGQWVNTVDYSIQLEADRVYPMQEDVGLSGFLIQDAGEVWEITTDDGTPEGINLPRTYRMSHSVNAVGKRSYDSNGNLIQEPWKNARDFVIPRLGFSSQFVTSSGVRDLPSYYGGYNHVRVENIDRQGGGYSVNETWILASGTALEDFTVETSQSIDDGLVSVNVQGSINGLEIRDPVTMSLTTTKYSNANDKFAQVSGIILTRAQNYTGLTLNIIPTQQTVGRNPITGSITYAYTYNNRPSNLITGSRSEVISINDNFHNNLIAEVPVLGRVLGPVLQNLNTTQPLTRELTIECVMPRPSFGSGTLSDLQSAFFGQRPNSQVSGIINACDPANQGYTQVYIGTNSEGWEPNNGRYHRVISWTFEI